MERIEYSVIIRTTGKAKEKYRRLLDSIETLIPSPKEIIVVLPEGYSLPEERIGTETFYFSPKGMVIQRLTGIWKCKTPYALICDDDVTFSKDFVQKLYKPVADGLCVFAAGPLYSFLPQGKGKILDFVMGNASPTVFHTDRYISVLKTSGYSYNNKLKNTKKYYETQSIAWTCFFADLTRFKEVGFEEEVWIDSHGYSALDDQTMFYKAWLRNIKTIVVSDAVYEHLDAKTSTKGNRLPSVYALEFNRIVFWNRFIYEQQSSVLWRLYSKICFNYRNVMNLLYKTVSVKIGKISNEEYETIRKGKKDGWEYIKSNEYSQLPPVKNGIS